MSIFNTYRIDKTYPDELNASGDYRIREGTIFQIPKEILAIILFIKIDIFKLIPYQLEPSKIIHLQLDNYSKA